MKRFKLNHLSWLPLSAASAAIALACGSDQPAPKDPTSYDSQYSAELQEERQDFINDTQQRLDQLENQIGQMQARLQHERQFVSSSQAAEWSQRLFELQLEQQQAQARLDRAQSVDLQGWDEMRDGLGNQVDRLEAAVGVVGASIANLFDGDDENESERQPVRGQDDPEDSAPTDADEAP